MNIDYIIEIITVTIFVFVICRLAWLRGKDKDKIDELEAKLQKQQSKCSNQTK